MAVERTTSSLTAWEFRRRAQLSSRDMAKAGAALSRKLQPSTARSDASFTRIRRGTDFFRAMITPLEAGDREKEYNAAASWTLIIRAIHLLLASAQPLMRSGSPSSKRRPSLKFQSCQFPTRMRCHCFQRSGARSLRKIGGEV